MPAGLNIGKIEWHDMAAVRTSLTGDGGNESYCGGGVERRQPRFVNQTDLWFGEGAV